ncbi:MAG: IS1182 family transposase [archaeon]
MAYIKSYRGQNYLLPPNLTSLFSKNHVAYLIEQITDSLDYSTFDNKYAGAGHPAYHPQIPLKLLLIGSVDKINSSRRLAKNSQENAVYIYLSEKTSPDFRTISDFRKDNKDLLKQVFLQLNKFAYEEGLIDLSHINVDGTSIKANASSNNNLDKKTLEKLSKYIEEQIEAGIKVDEQEDKLYGDRGMHQLPKNLDDKEKRRPIVRKIVEEINKAMKERSKENIKKIKDDLNKIKQNLEEKNQKRYSPIDPDSRFMKNKKGRTELSYNAQISVDKNGIIVQNNVVQEADDRNQLVPNINAVEESFGKLKDAKVLADAGYEKAKAIQELDKRGYDVYVPGKKSKKSEFKYDEEKDEYISPKGDILKRRGKYFHKKRGEYLTIYKGIVDGKERVIHALPEEKTLNRIKEKLKTEGGKRIYGIRKQTVERSFADIKHHRGLRSFNLRGIDKVRTEFNLTCTGSNLVRINNLIHKPPS